MVNYQWYFFKFIKLAENGNNEMQISVKACHIKFQQQL
jgi:hypothetical protein